MARRTAVRTRGTTLVEVLAATMILSFIVAATAGVYMVGQQQQRIARNYSDAQTDLRSALDRATRTVRHGYEIVESDTGAYSDGGWQLPSTYRISNAGGIAVRVPQPTGASVPTVEDAFYLSNGTLYAVYATAQGTASAPIDLIDGVKSIVFTYMKQDGTVVTPDGTAATMAPVAMVQITLTAVRGMSSPTAALKPGVAQTTVTALVTMRNAIAGM